MAAYTKRLRSCSEPIVQGANSFSTLEGGEEVEAEDGMAEEEKGRS